MTEAPMIADNIKTLYLAGLACSVDANFDDWQKVETVETLVWDSSASPS